MRGKKKKKVMGDDISLHFRDHLQLACVLYPLAATPTLLSLVIVARPSFGFVLLPLAPCTTSKTSDLSFSLFEYDCGG